MNIDKFKHQHEEILDAISSLRTLVQTGIASHAAEIAQRIIAISSIIKLHLAVEDRFLYPTLEDSDDRTLKQMGRLYRDEMQTISKAYIAFAVKWNTPSPLMEQPEQFRSEANVVLKLLHDRIKREDRDFYPAIEESQTVA